MIHQDIRCVCSLLHCFVICELNFHQGNILVNDASEAVLSDFGLSRIDSSFLTVSTSSIEHGCLRWKAPELYRLILDKNADSDPPPRPSTATDMYAFGMTALEMLTEKIPFATTALDAVVLLDLYRNPGLRPARPKDKDMPNRFEISDGVWDCLETCWSKDVSLRPRAAEVRASLLLEVKSYEAKLIGTFASRHLLWLRPNMLCRFLRIRTTQCH